MLFNNTLHKLGFSPIEANVFIVLCKHGSLTGYEVAKLTGISRSNVYAALYSLQDKGKCYASEGETTKYVAISKEELLLSTEREFHTTLEEIKEYYPVPLEANEPYITIKGYDNVLTKLKNAILLCHSHLYLLCASDVVALLQDELKTISTEKKVTILCDKAIKLPSSITLYHRLKSPEGFHMIIDTEAVLTGDLNASSPQCLFSKDLSLVRLMRESFITELDMIQLNKR
ncbi:helix-turn-helix domain-containing protein [Cellulosilyticum sp. ST5]|uniref:Transcriptional regulator, TrmB n=1 Tax=Cellulosilyticum lentocellum (strain ATCC 49066 / DSM 5427 / NCIMB 11756 / RHM5) TaxID=642492 RepID=F2JLQ7_CELLD|nr:MULTISPECIES: helix-turn-helix domain-containing protein [Cellulosilyticum]ADZ84583.1 transcriptional regulator, TrmB [Cellulosilyticum lentocellum DSM 5427]QEH70062.1 TrmB family transcriptional regulator [Cellulosilyticum sp. WCF-2]